MGLLRILLAICVLCSHSHQLGGLHWLSGDMAVELFFVVSGFYMQLILSTRYTKVKLGNAWVSQFYKARYFRLLPTYLLGSFLVVAAGWFRDGTPPYPVWHFVGALPNVAANVLFKVFFFITNATLLFQDATMFLAVRNGLIHWSASFQNTDSPLWQGLTIPQAWSLGIELSFYLLAPFLLNLRSRWLVIGCCIGLGAKIAAITALNLGDPWTYRFFPFELGYFLLGAIAFRYRHALGRLAPDSIAKYAVYPFVAAFSVWLVPVYLPTLVYPLVLALVLPVLFRVTSKSRVDRVIGELSYPFYIFHLFCLRAVSTLVKSRFQTAGDSIAWLALVLTLVLSATVLALEIRWIEPWRGRFARPVAPPQARKAAAS